MLSGPSGNTNLAGVWTLRSGRFSVFARLLRSTTVSLEVHLQCGGCLVLLFLTRSKVALGFGSTDKSFFSRRFDLRLVMFCECNVLLSTCSVNEDMRT